MAPVTLPPSFYNSFWSADYRSGLEILFRELDKGCKEAEELASFIEAQAQGHHTLSQTLLIPSPSASSSTSSLQHTLLSLRGASSARGEAHRALALDLENRILVGFEGWLEKHRTRVKEGKGEMLGKSGAVGVWEKEVGRLNTLKTTYVNKTRAADESEDDARFAPASSASAVVKSPSASSTDGYTASPKPQFAALKRSGTVADRISEKLRAASISSSNGTSVPVSPIALGAGAGAPSRLNKPVLSVDGKTLPPPPSPLRPGTPENGHAQGSAGAEPSSPGSPKEDAFIPPSDPDGRPTMGGQGLGPTVLGKDRSLASLDVQPPPVLLSGLSLSAQGLKDLLRRFDAYLLTTPSPNADTSAVSTKSNIALATRHRTSMLGTYEKTFSGEEVADWLKDNVEGFGGDWERCVDAARELTSMGHFSRIGVGVARGFEPGYDTYYILRVNPATDPSPVGALSAAALEKMNANLPAMPHIPNIPNMSSIGSPLSPATSANIQTMLKSYVPARFAGSDEPQHVRLRREAQKAEEAYKEGVRSAEGKRLEMEERLERGLRVWERWERERLTVIQQVLKQYESALSRLPARLASLQEATTLSVEAYNPDADLKALIEGNRTGPFRPQAHIYESLEIDQPEVNFGIDLRKWAGDAGWRSATRAPEREKGAIPDVLGALLEAVEVMGSGATDDEKRKAWIYEVPLPETHALRSSLNNPNVPKSDLVEVIKTFNMPIAAGTVKLWLLELNPPVLGWEGWEDAKAIYPTVGADQERDMTSAVISVLGRLPGVQLYVLDALIGYLKKMIDSTKTQEAEEIYVTKLALSLGRCILRPATETDLTIGDRTPSLFFADLLNLYSAVLPPLVNKKKQEADRVMPVRKRTVLVDQRISRRNISEDETTQELLERQMALQHPTPGRERGRDLENEATPTRHSGAPQPSIGNSAGSGSALGLTGTAATGATTATGAASSSSAPSAPSAPRMADPKDSDDEADPPFNPASIQFTPPTPAQPAAEQFESSASASLSRSNSNQHQLNLSAAPGGEDGSATADILESLGDAADDAPISGSGSGPSGSVGLKRATSGDTGSVSRLRGPRGARGPRAPGTRGAAGAEGQSAEDEASAGPKVGGPGGAVHRSKGSVSAMAARFESK